jgi:hypothetical protein
MSDWAEAGPVATPSRVAGWRCGLAVAAASAGIASVAAAAEVPLTIMPYQTATFVSDPLAAEEMSTFAEFSARLLYWMDTPRAPVVLSGQVLKTALLPFVAEWRGQAPAGPASAAVRERVANAYQALESPRLLRIIIDQEVTIERPRRAEGLVGETLQIPCVIENRRAIACAVRLGSSGGGGTVVELTLLPGQARGLILHAGAATADGVVRLAAEVEGRTEAVDVPVEWHQTGRLQVNVVGDTGAPTASRVYVTGADDRAYAPPGTMHRIVSGEAGQPHAGDPYFFSEGSFELSVPAGDTRVEVVKGLEFEPVQLQVAVKPGTSTPVTVRLRRRPWVKQEGWFSGDVHVHANLFAQTLITPRDVRLVAEAEDIHVMNLLSCNDPRTATINDRQHFSGAPHEESTPSTVLYFSEEMRNDIYGHVGFLGLKTFVEPAYFGWPNSPFPHDYPDNYPQCVEAMTQGAAVTYVHPALPSAFPVDIALGVAHTIDVMSQNDEERSTSYWYQLLNCGFRCPASAGPDAFLNIPVHLIPGGGRVFVQVGQELSFSRWLEGFKQGRSFVTNGPLLRFTVNGAGAGAELIAPDRMEVRIVGRAEAFVPMETLDVIINGAVVHRVRAGQDALAIDLTVTLPLERSSWIALRASGPGHRLVPNDRTVYAHTSPVYVTIAEQPIASRAAAEFFISQIDALIAKMDARGSFAQVEQRDELVQRFRQAQAIYHHIAAIAPADENE